MPRRRPLMVAGHCRRLLLLLRRSWSCCDGADAARSLASPLEVPSRPSSRCCWQHLEESRGGTSRGDASCCCRAASAPSQKHQLRRSSISSVTAASACDGSVPRLLL